MQLNTYGMLWVDYCYEINPTQDLLAIRSNIPTHPTMGNYARPRELAIATHRIRSSINSLPARQVHVCTRPHDSEPS